MSVINGILSSEIKFNSETGEAEKELRRAEVKKVKIPEESFDRGKGIRRIRRSSEVVAGKVKAE